MPIQGSDFWLFGIYNWINILYLSHNIYIINLPTLDLCSFTIRGTFISIALCMLINSKAKNQVNRASIVVFYHISVHWISKTKDSCWNWLITKALIVKLTVPIWSDKWRVHNCKPWHMKNSPLTSVLNIWLFNRCAKANGIRNSILPLKN